MYDTDYNWLSRLVQMLKLKLDFGTLQVKFGEARFAEVTSQSGNKTLINMSRVLSMSEMNSGGECSRTRVKYDTGEVEDVDGKIVRAVVNQIQEPKRDS